MALLSVANLVFSFGDRLILDGCNLTLNKGDAVGLVGRNGCGKSTLMKLIAGIETHKPESGQIQIAKGSTVGYLHQDPNLNPESTLREEAGRAFEAIEKLQQEIEDAAIKMGEVEGDELDQLMKDYERLEEQLQAAGGYAMDHQVEETLHGVGLMDETFNVKVKDLSGGQRGRLALAKLLLTKPDLLLLDEPTNHLDIAGRVWLEEYLSTYPGAVVLISHDRWLLDRAVSCIYELELGSMVDYPGNYHKFRDLKEERIKAQDRAFEKQQTYIKQQKEFIAKYKAGQRAKQAKGRESRLDRFIDQSTLERPVELDSISLRFTPKARPGDNIVVAEGLGVTYDQNKLFENVDVHVRRGDRIGVIGPNGAGKSTMIAQMLEQLPGDHAGKIKQGSQVDIGWFRQVADMPEELNVVEYLMNFTDPRSEQKARDMAGAFLFSGLDQEKPMKVMSGGEKARARLAGIMMMGHNVLVLDEPTNHLDIPACERLEESLKRYTSSVQKYGQNKDIEGTLILISHDRWLLDELVDQLFIFDGKGGVEYFEGSYSEYIQTHGTGVLVDDQKNKPVEAKPKPAPKPIAPPPPAPQKNGKSKDKGKKKTNSRYGHLSLETIEEQIEKLETQITQVSDQLADPDTYRDKDKFNALQDEHQKLTDQLTPLEAEWALRAD